VRPRKMVAIVVVDRANQDHLIGVPGVTGQALGNTDAGHVAVDGPKRAAVLGGGFGFGIIGFELAGAPVEPKKDAGRAFIVSGPQRPEAEPIRQGKPQKAQKAGLERATTTQALAVSATSALLDLKHGGSPYRGGCREVVRQ